MIKFTNGEKSKIHQLHFSPTERGFIYKNTASTASGVKPFELEVYKIESEIVLYLDDSELRKLTSQEFHKFRLSHDLVV